MHTVRGIVCGVLLLLTAEAWSITVRIPQDSLRIWNRGSGLKGSQIYVPILIDTLGPADSIGGFELKLVCDTGRLRASGINTSGTVCDGDQFVLRDGHYVPGGFVISVLGDGRGVITGSGILVQVVFQVLDDTAGFVRIGFDSLWTEFDKFVGPSIVKVKGTAVEGGITFLPVAEAAVRSDSVSYGQDTLIIVPVRLDSIHGDVIKSIGLRLHSDNANFVFADVDTAGTLVARIAREGWWQSEIHDSGRTLTIQAERSTAVQALQDSAIVIQLKILVHGTASFHCALTWDSLVVRGFAERFVVGAHGGEYAVTYVPPVEVVQPTVVPNTDGFTLFPNPATAGALVNGVAAGEEIRAYRVFDIFGRSIAARGSEQHDGIALETANLPAGMYMVRMWTATGTRTAHLTVVH